MKRQPQFISYKAGTLVSLGGILLFLVLYLTAAFLYPGGSQVNKTSRGFDWINNYWCDLLSTTSQNGYYNPARPVSITAMIILCGSLAIFWVQLPQKLKSPLLQRQIIQYGGVASMMITIFLFTSFHEEVINMGGCLGFLAIAGTLILLYKNQLYKLFIIGLACVLLCFINYYIYRTHDHILFLPLIQKFTFLSFLGWIVSIQVYLSRK